MSREFTRKVFENHIFFILYEKAIAIQIIIIIFLLLWIFYQLSFPEFDVNDFKVILSIQRFSIWPSTEKFS